MGYEISLGLAWDELEQISHSGKCGVRLLDEDYLVFVSLRKVLHKTSGQEAEEMRTVLLLHYLLGIKKHGFFPTGEWISFRQLEGGPVFWPAFEESSLVPLARGFQECPEGLIANLLQRLGGKIIQGGDVAVEVAAFQGILVRMIFWKGDSDLPPAVTMLFDRGLTGIYSTEDITVMLDLVAQESLRI
jgi:hypothetical protein